MDLVRRSFLNGMIEFSSGEIRSRGRDDFGAIDFEDSGTAGFKLLNVNRNSISILDKGHSVAVRRGNTHAQQVRLMDMKSRSECFHRLNNTIHEVQNS